MDEIIKAEATNYFSDKLEKEGPVPLFQYLIDLGARFTRTIGPPDEYMDPIKKYHENPKKEYYCFCLSGFEYSFFVSAEFSYLFLYGGLDFDEKHKNELCAATLFDLTEKLIAKYSFKYGYFDLSGIDHVSDKSIAATQLKKIHWANFYGKPYVEKYGKEFLLGAPGWKKRELADGTIEYILTESLFTRPDPTLEKEIKEYFAPKAKVKLFRPSPGPVGFDITVREVTE